VRSTARAKKRPAAHTKKVRVDRAARQARREPIPPPHAVLLPEGATRQPRVTPAEKAARKLIVLAAHDVDFVHAAITTRLVIEPDGFHVQIDTANRETGDPCTIDLRWNMPPFLASREHALDWIYSCVRDAWVHELNEALFVDGIRRRELHTDHGKLIPPPDEAVRAELDSFKVQLATFLSAIAPVTGGPQSDLEAFKMQLAAFLMRACR
jgi:hypothetical protein